MTSQELADQLVDIEIPAVNVSWYRFRDDKIPRCTCSEIDVAQQAVRYFLDRGFRQFAYCGSSIRTNYIDRLGQAFIEILQKQAYACHRYLPQLGPDGFLPNVEEFDALTEWLKELPKPVALLAFDSIQARYVTEACGLANIEVPHEVAVLGGEYDFLSCTVSKPQLSSVDQSPFQVGFAAAELLAQLLDGEPVPEKPTLLPAARVLTRQSTDTVAVNDELLAECVRFIKEHSHERIQVSDILRSVPISRRALEKGFRKFLSRSPAEEIRRVRVMKAVTLLCDTSWPMPKIASACGFERPELLTRAFRREMNMTPSEFRKKSMKNQQSIATSDSSGANGSTTSLDVDLVKPWNSSSISG